MRLIWLIDLKIATNFSDYVVDIFFKFNNLYLSPKLLMKKYIKHIIRQKHLFKKNWKEIMQKPHHMLVWQGVVKFTFSPKFFLSVLV